MTSGKTLSGLTPGKALGILPHPGYRTWPPRFRLTLFETLRMILNLIALL